MGKMRYPRTIAKIKIALQVVSVLIQSHSLARFSFELSGNLNYRLFFYSKFSKNFELDNSMN